MRRSVGVLALALGACRAPHAADPARGAHDVWTYDLAVASDGKDLRVDAELTTAIETELHVKPPAGRFIADIEVVAGDGWKSVARDRIMCAPPRCRVRYRYELDAAATALHDSDAVTESGGVYAAPASSFLVHPAGVSPRLYRVRVIRSAVPVLLGIAPAPDGSPNTYEAHGIGLDDGPYFAFGAWRTHVTRIGGADITIGIAPGARGAMSDDETVRWIDASGTALATYLHGSPAARPLVLVVPGEGATIDGKTLGDGGASIFLTVGPDVSPAIARESWVLTHEMIHLEMPSLGFPHAWLEEGLATYLEPIVRVRAGELSDERMWGDLLRDAEQGLPKPGDEGLERTHTWERTYWGGAIFYLLADIAIRERTGNARSLDDALRGIARASTGVAERWSVARFLAVGDAAAGGQSLRELYDRLAFAPERIDLAALWSRLGVARRGDRVVFDDAAPLASVRRGIGGR